MCGRFEIHSTLEIIARIFQVGAAGFVLKPGFNIAPGGDVAIVINDGTRRIVSSRWGFVPSWSKETARTCPINVRAETAATNAAFRESFEGMRCLVVADGFYEWKKAGATKNPYYIHQRSGGPFGFAGLYSRRITPHGETMHTCAIITTAANELISPIHDRMPVIEEPAYYDQWLDPRIRDRKMIEGLLHPVPADTLEVYPVTPKMNSAGYDTPENILPLPVSSA
ncbi:MAG TPA: SOS response-associated peptidase [Nitrospirota bacterium]|nr:SOS response-associated peptidase [Nitrospirota bacterium]